MTRQTDDTALPHREELFGIAYRMLGEVTQAEDIVQEVHVAWFETDQTTIDNPRAYLGTITARRALDVLRSARHRREVYVGPWLPEPLVQPPPVPARTPEEEAILSESLTFAMLRLLEQLNPVERAVFLMREVFQYEFSEIGRIVERTPVNCRKILTRARDRIRDDRPRFDADPTHQEALLDRFLVATTTADLSGLESLIAADATAWSDGGGKASAATRPILGAHRIARFLIGLASKIDPDDRRVRMERAWINQQPGLLLFEDGALTSATAFHFLDGQLAGLYMIRNPDKLAALARHALSNTPPPS